jgi:predicted amidohydrolase
MKNPKVLVAQMEIVPNNPKANFGKIKSFFNKARRDDCDFIVFPEYCDGICFPDFFKEKNQEKFLRTMKKLAKENEIYCIAGTTLERRNSKFYNSCYAISRKGEILGRYVKRKLIPKGEEHLQEGKDELIFETEFGKVGVLICRDMVYPELTRSLAEKGVKIIFCPAFWSYFTSDYGTNKNIKTNFPIDADIKFLKICPQARAMESEVFFIVSNAAGEYHLEKYKEELAGHSSVNGPLQGNIHSLNTYDEGKIISILNLDYIEDSKITFGIIN